MSEDSNRRPLPVGLDEGTGRPLVLIPGYAMRPDMYRRTARLLAERCRVILIDIYATRGRWRYEDVLESFTATLDNLGLERASFLGHSFGSGIELGFAVRHPQRVVRVVEQSGRSYTETPEGTTNIRIYGTPSKVGSTCPSTQSAMRPRWGRRSASASARQ
jgi:pimeloyl-ACP methyl ester carboxylesterase